MFLGFENGVWRSHRWTTVAEGENVLRVLLFVGLLSYEDFQELTAGLDDVEFAGVFVHENKIREDWNSARTGLRTWTRKDLMSVKAYAPRTPYHDRYEKILAAILSDTRSFYLMERVFGTGASRTVFNHTLTVENILWNALTILFETRAQRIVCTNTPHDVTWFIARAAEMLGIDILLTAVSPLPWRVWVVRGLDAQQPLPDAQPEAKGGHEVSAAVKEFVTKNRASYELAIPSYERIRRERYRGAFFNPGIELQAVLSSRSPRTGLMRIYSAFRKKALLRLYNRLSSGYSAPNKYVVFFLHFQPERTTLPDGYTYTQQWLAIRALLDALPPDWHLVVREHPSTFRGAFSPAVRDGRLYHAVSEVPNAKLAPLHLTPFELIDKAKAVATITGTVGVEALSRGKPVIVFGAAQYRGAKGAFAVKSVADIKAAISEIEAGTAVPSDEELFAYFSWVERYSFPKLARINGAIPALRRALTLDLDVRNGGCERSAVNDARTS